MNNNENIGDNLKIIDILQKIDELNKKTEEENVQLIKEILGLIDTKPHIEERERDSKLLIEERERDSKGKSGKKSDEGSDSDEGGNGDKLSKLLNFLKKPTLDPEIREKINKVHKILYSSNTIPIDAGEAGVKKDGAGGEPEVKDGVGAGVKKVKKAEVGGEAVAGGKVKAGGEVKAGVKPVGKTEVGGEAVAGGEVKAGVKPVGKAEVKPVGKAEAGVKDGTENV